MLLIQIVVQKMKMDMDIHTDMVHQITTGMIDSLSIKEKPCGIWLKNRKIVSNFEAHSGPNITI